MAKPNYQFEKRQRDLAKKKKQDEKRQRKLAEKTAGEDGDSAAAKDPSASGAVGAGAVAPVKGTEPDA
ncbi:MAG: hypothetical protein HZC23_11060 [Rhodocyclales bacterium]|nr:hypothetical protein [Rhodocyclales bacterium]